jgi:hypothetical protein
MKHTSLVLVGLLVAVIFVALPACGGGSDPQPARPKCNPLGGESGGRCLAPFPSSAFLVPDSTTVTGFRVDLDPSALPVSADDKPVPPGLWNSYDGFSPNGLIVAEFPGGVSADGLPGWRNLATSVLPSSPTILLDMETGELVPHFSEVDVNSTHADSDRALLIHPAQRLKPAHRYAVAIQKTVKSASGGALPENAAFAALLAGHSFDAPLFDRVASRYPDIFAKLEAAGVHKADLALAWDYVTASDEFLTRDLLSMRAQALAALGDGSGIEYSGDEVATDNPDVAHMIIGTYQAPNFLSDGEADLSVIVRDEAGLPRLSATMDANFAAIVPACAETSPTPLPVLVFGHGLFGSAAGYVDDDLLQRVANENCVIIVAGDWIGLTERNIATVALALNDVGRAPTVSEKLMQAVINFMTLTRLATARLPDDPLFQKEDGTSVIDPTRVWYFGASLGGIMGGVFMAYEPSITLGALGVPGCNWTMCFERSYAWPPLGLALRGAYPGFVLDEELIALFGMVMDKIDPGTVSQHLVADPLPETPAKQIWLYYSIGDSLVSNVASEKLIRSMGLQMTGPSLSVPYGVTERAGPGMTGATVFDEHPTPLPSDLNLAPSDDDGTHGGVHNRNAVISMLKHFFETGELVHGCAVDGVPAPCDCATGACDNTLDAPP